MDKQAQMELLGGYVKTAATLLNEEYGDNFTTETVEKLASALYEADVQASMEKEAEAVLEYGFLDEFSKLAGYNFETMDEVQAFVDEVVAEVEKG